MRGGHIVRTVLIVETGFTYPEIAGRHGDFDDWFARVLARDGLRIARCVPPKDEPLPTPNTFDAVVVTGSPAMVTDREAWSERTASWLRALVARNVPVLGVCYGHQLLAHALGGVVDYHPQGREIGTHPIRLHPVAQDDLLFSGLPTGFDVHLTHMQSVRRLPEGSVLLAGGDFEPHQAFRVGRCAWGVQFHPEFCSGIMRCYVERLAPRMREEGFDIDALKAGIRETPHARRVLERFAELVVADVLVDA